MKHILCSFCIVLAFWAGAADNNLVRSAWTTTGTAATALTALGGIDGVNLTAPAGLTSPTFTKSGNTLTGSMSWASQTANYVLASPSGVSGAPSFRALASDDIPSLDASKITTGVFSSAQIPDLPASSITAGTFSGSYTVSTSLTISGAATSDSTLRLGNLEFQPYALNNAWFGDNVYFDGLNFVRRATGYAGMFYFAGAEAQFRFAPSAGAGTTISGPPIQLKIDQDGTVCFGGSAINNSSGNYSGASVVVNGTQATFNVPVTTTNNVTMHTLTTGTQTVAADTTLDSNSPNTTFVTADLVTITLPQANTVSGRQLAIKALAVGTTSVVIGAGEGGQTIDDSASYTLTAQYQCITVQSDGTNWFIMSRF